MLLSMRIGASSYMFLLCISLLFFLSPKMANGWEDNWRYEVSANIAGRHHLAVEDTVLLRNWPNGIIFEEVYLIYSYQYAGRINRHTPQVRTSQSIHNTSFIVLYRNENGEFIQPIRTFERTPFNSAYHYHFTDSESVTRNNRDYGTITYHRTNFNRFVYTVLPSGHHYEIRWLCKDFRTREPQDTNPLEMWNTYGILDSMTVSIPDYFPLDHLAIRMQLLNASEWRSWLPSVYGIPDTTNQDITLCFQLRHDDSNTEEARLRVKFRVWDITWYPGTRTNSVCQYNNTNLYPVNPFPNSIRLAEWNEQTSWRNCLDTSLADFRVHDSLNADQECEIEFLIDSTGSMDSDRDRLGYYEITFLDTFTQNSTFEITLSSYDFGGRCWVTPYVSAVDTSNQGLFNRWRSVPVVMDSLYGTQDIVLPVPRDCEYIQQNRDSSGTVYLQVGDRIADSWEEQYIVSGTTPHGSAQYDRTYWSIEDLRSYPTVIWLNSGYFPPGFPPYRLHHQQDTGDFLTNFEKYRGFYGVIHSPSDTVLSHVRLDPRCSNLFLLPFDSVSKMDEFPFLELGLDFLRDIEESSNTIIYLLHPNIGLGDNECFFEERYSCPANNQDMITKHPYLARFEKSLLLNNNLCNLPGHSPAVAAYCYQTDRIPPALIESGLVFMGSFGSLIPENTGPCSTILNLTFSENLAHSNYACRDSSGIMVSDSDLIRTQQAAIYASQLGRFLKLNTSSIERLNRERFHLPEEKPF